MIKFLNRIIHLVPMIAIMGAIFFLSHQPGDSLYMPSILWFDKLAHMAIYALLAATVLYAFYASYPRFKNDEGKVLASLLTMTICILYGIGDEFHQSFIPDRFVSVGDVVADAVGAVAACVVWFLWEKRKISIRSL
jgi:VanZ family protein